MGGVYMSAIDRLYSIDNKTIKKTVNIDDSLYKRLMKFVNKNRKMSIFWKIVARRKNT